jgi:hypothetical protein
MKTFFAVTVSIALVTVLAAAQPLPKSKGGVHFCCIDGKHTCRIGDWSPGVGCFCSELDGGYSKPGVTCK